MVDTRFSVSVHIMVSLAYAPDELTNSAYLAKVLKTNPTFVRKLVTKLVEANLIESYRGKGGGIKIAKAPGQISLKEIYLAAMDDKAIMSTPNKAATKACKVSCSMSNILCDVVDGIESATQNYLSKISVADLVKKIS